MYTRTTLRYRVHAATTQRKSTVTVTTLRLRRGGGTNHAQIPAQVARVAMRRSKNSEGYLQCLLAEQSK